MNRQTDKNVHYKREKGKVEISGMGSSVKFQIWFDLITSRLTIILVIIAILLFPKVEAVSMIWRLLQQIF